MFFMFSFQKAKLITCCAYVKPPLQGLGLIIQFLGKKRMLQITNECECHVLLSLIVSTHNFQTKVTWALEFLTPHLIVLNPQVFMILWRLMRKWHRQWWKNNWIISRSKKLLNKSKKFIRMVESAWGTFIVCWIYSLTNYRVYWFQNWSGKNFQHCKFSGAYCPWSNSWEWKKAFMEEINGIIDQIGVLDIKENDDRL